MFRIIHPNRYFIWTLVFLLAASLTLMFWIESYLLEIDRGAAEEQSFLRSGWKTYRSQRLGLQVNYPAAWDIEFDPLDEHSFVLLNPVDFGENITFSKTDPKYENLIRNNLKIASESQILIDRTPGIWIKSSDSRDAATGNVVLVELEGELYYIAGSAKNFEKIIMSIKFLDE